ncbi:MAG: RHS repeat-associated core domain-containing protein [Nanoarchaeota archaeon]|nr:RHS repeat-associated core domain-containing protein [Nanoarchaeota archaeon]
MKMKIYLWNIVFFMSLLIVMLPVCFAESLSLQYDSAGNLITGDGFYREYNSLNQLSTVRLNNATGTILEMYVHDLIEEKVLIKNVSYNNGTWKETVYYWFDEYIEVHNNSGIQAFTYIEHEGMRVAEKHNDSSVYYVAPDHLGSSQTIMNSSGEIISNFSTTPFGVILDSDNVSRFSYEGKEYDPIVGQYDFHFRGYKASWGKFTQPDTVIQNIYNPQTLNRYAFEHNNPWSRIDPDGHIAPLVAAMGAGALIGGAIGGLIYVGSHMISGEKMTWKGAGSYIVGGAIAGALAPIGGAAFGYGASAKAIGGAALTSSFGAGTAKVAMNYGDGQPMTEGVGSAMVFGGLTGGVGQKFLPMARTWLIKHPLSYATTVTGNKFAMNLFAENIIASLLSRMVQHQANGAQAVQGSGNSGGSSRSNGSGDSYDNLREEAENAGEDETAGDIIRRWRENN